MTSKLVVNTIESDTGISSVSFASSISMSSTSKFHFSAAGIDIGADTNINRPEAGVLGFNINSGEKLRIASDGKIGINTTPLHSFEIFTGADHENIIQVKGTNSAGVYAGMGVYQGNAVFTGGGIGSNSAGIVFRTAASGSEAEKLIIDSNGKVMIGTSTPSSNSAAYMFTVADPSNGGGNCGITIRSGNTSGTINQGSIFYSDATSGSGEYAGYLQYDHSTSPEWFRIGVASNPRFYVYGNGNAEIVDGDLKLASGHGIDFSATSNSSGANISELLDDYEEGSWTPTWHLTTSNYGPNYTHQMGAYTKIGRQVTVYFSLYSTSLNGSTGGLQIAGLPFTDNTSPVEYPATAGAFPIYGFNGWTGEYISLQVVSGKIQLYGVQKNNTSYAPIMNNQVNAGGALFLKGQVTYNV